MESIQLLVCTQGEGIHRVPAMLLPPMPGVSYLISWQVPQVQHAEVPQALRGRDDVRVVCQQGRGLARNRNHALTYASGDILVLADDDCRYTAASFQLIRDAFAQAPHAHIIAFQAADTEGRPLRSYPAAPYRYPHLPRGAYVASVEMCMRRAATVLAFDERFGLGAPYLCCGEEDVFLHQAHGRGYVIEYVPQVMVQTPAGTTGTRFLTDAAVQRSKGAVLAMLYGFWGALARCLWQRSVLRSCSLMQRFRILHHMWQGVRYIVSA